MSNISNRHTVVEYVASGSNKSAALSGQRLSVAKFKKDKDGNKARNSQCVSVPVIALAGDEYEQLQPHINEWFRSVQDEIIRAAIIDGGTDVTDEQISVAAVKAHLSAVSAGDRLTGDAIKEWFVAELQDVLTVAFADKLGYSDTPTDEQSEKLTKMCNVYRDKFAAMAGGRTMFDAATRAKLSKALELADNNDGIGAKLVAKLQAMKEPNVEELLGL